MRFLFAALIMLAAMLDARAQSTLPYTYPVTVGTSSVPVLPTNQARKQLVFINPNASAIVSVCPAISRVTSTSITCTLHGPGAIPILPYAFFPLAGIGGNPNLPQAWNAISDTGGSSLTVLEWE